MGISAHPADAAAGVDKRGLFSWKKTEGFVNTQKKKPSLGIGHHFQGVFNVAFHFYPHFLCHHPTFGAGIGMLLAGMRESGGSLWNKSEFFVFGDFFWPLLQICCFFLGFPCGIHGTFPKKLSLGLKDPSRRSRRLTKPCVCPSFCLDVCREGKLVSLELKQPKYYPNIWV